MGRWIDWLRATERVRSQQRDRCGAVGGLGRRDDNAARVGVKKIDWRCHSINIASIIQLRRRRRRWSAADCMRRPPAWYSHTVAPPGGKGRGSFPPMGGRPKIMQYVCSFIVMELFRITRQVHSKAVEQRATLIHRQYNRNCGTSYSRPPIDPYLTSPRYKIQAAPLQPDYWLVNIIVIKCRQGAYKIHVRNILNIR